MFRQGSSVSSTTPLSSLTKWLAAASLRFMIKRWIPSALSIDELFAPTLTPFFGTMKMSLSFSSLGMLLVLLCSWAGPKYGLEPAPRCFQIFLCSQVYSPVFSADNFGLFLKQLLAVFEMAWSCFQPNKKFGMNDIFCIGALDILNENRGVGVKVAVCEWKEEVFFGWVFVIVGFAACSSWSRNAHTGVSCCYGVCVTWDDLWLRAHRTLNATSHRAHAWQ